MSSGRNLATSWTALCWAGGVALSLSISAAWAKEADPGLGVKARIDPPGPYLIGDRFNFVFELRPERNGVII